MSEKLLQAIRALVAHTLLSMEFKIPLKMAWILSAPLYNDIITELTKLDEVENYNIDTMIIWFIEYMADRAAEKKDEADAEELELAQQSMLGLLKGIDLSQHPQLHEKITELSEQEDMSIWEDYLEELDDAPPE